jgi:predicted O-methyltransferase YrrM
VKSKLNNYKFDHDWFSNNIEDLDNIFSDKNFEWNILEIGSFEGRSTSWFLENLPRSRIVCIDTWNGGSDHDPNNSEINFLQVEENFDHNMTFFEQSRYRKMKMDSYDALIQLYQEKNEFHFVYIDGSHVAKDVNSDLVLSWRMLKNKGLVYCDDYLWGFNDPKIKNSMFKTPKLGVDSFVNLYGNELNPFVGISNYCFAFKKV